ncbi:hypothetical protein BYT27DRAFT_7245117 [Phlegmacium glaucopus]|nr:hypothetical protein BYT27DRAFT_7245117 [Phlegmacium glaucopus]
MSRNPGWCTMSSALEKNYELPDKQVITIASEWCDLDIRREMLFSDTADRMQKELIAMLPSSVVKILALQNANIPYGLVGSILASFSTFQMLGVPNKSMTRVAPGLFIAVECFNRWLVE